MTLPKIEKCRICDKTLTISNGMSECIVLDEEANCGDHFHIFRKTKFPSYCIETLWVENFIIYIRHSERSDYQFGGTSFNIYPPDGTLQTVFSTEEILDITQIVSLIQKLKKNLTLK